MPLGSWPATKCLWIIIFFVIDQPAVWVLCWLLQCFLLSLVVHSLQGSCCKSRKKVGGVQRRQERLHYGGKWVLAIFLFFSIVVCFAIVVCAIVSGCHCCLCWAFSWDYVLVCCGGAYLIYSKISNQASLGSLTINCFSLRQTPNSLSGTHTLFYFRHLFKHGERYEWFWPISQPIHNRKVYNNCLIERYGIAYSASQKQARLRTATKVKGHKQQTRNKQQEQSTR